MHEDYIMSRTPQSLRALIAEYLSFTDRLVSELLSLEELTQDDFVRVEVEHQLLLKRMKGLKELPLQLKKDLQAVAPPRIQHGYPKTWQALKDDFRYCMLNLASRGRRLGNETKLRDILRDYRDSMRHVLHQIDEYDWTD
jgi:hypothetical protein